MDRIEPIEILYNSGFVGIVTLYRYLYTIAYIEA